MGRNVSAFPRRSKDSSDSSCPTVACSSRILFTPHESFLRLRSCQRSSGSATSLLCVIERILSEESLEIVSCAISKTSLRSKRRRSRLVSIEIDMKRSAICLFCTSAFLVPDIIGVTLPPASRATSVPSRNASMMILSPSGPSSLP